MGIDWFGLILIMLVAGVAGGTVNFSMQRSEHEGWSLWLQSIAVGCGASFLMPLFLNTISSELVKNILNDSGPNSSRADVFIFFGFCLLAAISSKAFIQTLTDKVLKETRETKKELEEAKEDISEIQTAVNPLIETETTDTETSVAKGSDTPTMVQLTENENTVLRTLTNSNYTLRSKYGVTKEAGISREEVNQRLCNLIEKGLADEVQGKKGTRWAVTFEGRRIANST